MTVQSIFNDLIVLFSFLLAGFVVREIIKPLQRYYIPASIIGGIIALIMGPQVLGLIEIPESFGSMASVMITLVLTCSVIGVDMDKSKANAYFTHLCIMVSVYGMQMFLGCWLGSLMENAWEDLPFGWGSEAVFSFWEVTVLLPVPARHGKSTASSETPQSVCSCLRSVSLRALSAG